MKSNVCATRDFRVSFAITQLLNHQTARWPMTRWPMIRSPHGTGGSWRLTSVGLHSGTLAYNSSLEG
ncbi:MAG: hypothetical protein ABSA59_11115 [Terriglobia bacterium]|jgi:hypothetical protein